METLRPFDTELTPVFISPRRDNNTVRGAPSCTYLKGRTTKNKIAGHALLQNVKLFLHYKNRSVLHYTWSPVKFINLILISMG